MKARDEHSAAGWRRIDDLLLLLLLLLVLMPLLLLSIGGVPVRGAASVSGILFAPHPLPLAKPFRRGMGRPLLVSALSCTVAAAARLVQK